MTKVHGEQILDGTIDATALDLTSIAQALIDAGIVVSTPDFSLVAETGAIVDGANTYITVAEAVAYATRRGVNLGTDGTAIAAMLIKAADYLDTKETAFQGQRVSSTQALCWPREYACLFDDDIDETTIPQRIKDAQAELVITLSQQVELMLSSNVSVKREKILNGIEVEYFSPTSTARLPKVDKLLQPLYKSRGYAGLATSR
jgi:hypothetical protein